MFRVIVNLAPFARNLFESLRSHTPSEFDWSSHSKYFTKLYRITRINSNQIFCRITFVKNSEYDYHTFVYISYKFNNRHFVNIVVRLTLSGVRVTVQNDFNEIVSHNSQTNIDSIHSSIKH